jgi:hypothetical protein
MSVWEREKDSDDKVKSIYINIISYTDEGGGYRKR